MSGPPPSGANPARRKAVSPRLTAATALLPGAARGVVQALHLPAGLAAFALAEALGGRIRRAARP